MSLAGWATIAAVAVGVQVGAATTVSRFVVGSLEPATLALLRYAIAVACLIPFVGIGFVHRIRAPHRWPVALLGIGQFALFIYLLNWGLQRINSAEASLLLATMPLFAMLFAVLRGLERLNIARLLGVVLTILGIAVMVVGKLMTQQRADYAWLGDIAVLLGAALGGFCSVLYRPYLRENSATDVGLLAMSASVLVLAIAAIAEDSIGRVLHLSAKQWAAIGFIGLSSAIGYVLWLFALAHADSSKVTAFLALSPVTALLLGASVFGEPVLISILVGGAFVIIGLLVSSLAMSRHQESTKPV